MINGGLKFTPFQEKKSIKGKLAKMHPKFKELIFQMKKQGVPVMTITQLTRLELTSSSVLKICEEVAAYYSQAAGQAEHEKVEETKEETYGDVNK